MSEPVYQLEKATFAYPGRTPALENITLSISGGENLILLGANGSGKSTLLMLLAGLQFSTAGCVRYRGEELTHNRLAHDLPFRRAFRKQVGVLFQESDLQLFCSTVREEIAYGPLQVLSRPEAAERTGLALAKFRLEALADLSPHALSGGEKRRVALAAVLALEPEVLLLDEPTASLDPRTCDEVLQHLEEYQSDGTRTVITATHDLLLSRDLGKTAVILGVPDQGAIVLPVEQALQDQSLLLEANLVSRRREL